MRIAREAIVEVAESAAVHKVHVANPRVADVDVGDERAAAVPPRMERLAEAEREPPHAAAKSEAKAAAAIETHESGSVERPGKARSRTPAPAVANVGPAAIVEGSKPPGIIVNPCPAPRADPVPVTPAVRRPTNGNHARIPHGAVIRNFTPRAVIVQIVVARHVARNILRGNRVVFLQISLLRPAIETVRFGRRADAVLNILGAVKFAALARMNIIGLAPGGNFAFAADHGNARGVA